MTAYPYMRATALIRARIEDGTLKPGSPAPSAAALARTLGFGLPSCRKAIRNLIADGTLIPGPSPSARPRVAGDPGHTGQGRRAAARRLSSSLAARRRVAGLRQEDLAAIIGYSVTAVGHAETGRLWQARPFWEQADKEPGASGELLGLYEDYRDAVEDARCREEVTAIRAGGADSTYQNGTASRCPTCGRWHCICPAPKP